MKKINFTTIGIHTCNGVTDNTEILEKVNEYGIVTQTSIRKQRGKNKYELYIRMNPNKANDNTIMNKFTDFEKVTRDMFNSLGISDFKWNRVDISFNSLDESFYKDNVKLFRMLIACISNMNKDVNTYDTKDFWSGNIRSLATKNGEREVEFYDKNNESQGQSIYKSRLELRSKRIRGTIEEEFMKRWKGLLMDAIDQYHSVQFRFNDNLVEVYSEDKKKEKEKREYGNIYGFILAKKDYFFSCAQLTDFLSKVGYSKKESVYKANYFRKRHDMEDVSQGELVSLVEAICKGINEYFSN